MMFQRMLPILLSVAVAATPGLNLQRARRRQCVNGTPTTNGNWTIDYDDSETPDKCNDGGYVLDPDWMNAHETVADALHLTMEEKMFPYGEYKCQFNCNAREACASFVGYQAQDSNELKGELYCHFFDSIIDKKTIVTQKDDAPFRITHTYNRLCKDDDE